MKYICILDFEATCDSEISNFDKSKTEIIEFPSLLYKLENDKLTKISEFHEYVRPTLNPILSKFCIELTGITQEIVNSADIFQNVFNRHYEWIKQNVENINDVVFLTCGLWDLKKQLPLELKNKNIENKDIYKRFINIKYVFENIYKIKPFGMVNMLKYLNLNLDGRHHSGIDDCKNISKILSKIINDGHTKFKIIYL
jgi:ERI1 exoribonuclease 3